MLHLHNINSKFNTRSKQSLGMYTCSGYNKMLLGCFESKCQGGKHHNFPLISKFLWHLDSCNDPWYVQLLWCRFDLLDYLGLPLTLPLWCQHLEMHFADSPRIYFHLCLSTCSHTCESQLAQIMLAYVFYRIIFLVRVKKQRFQNSIASHPILLFLSLFAIALSL